MASKTRKEDTSEFVREQRNEDPISHQAGAHPAAVGVGTAAGGALAGAAAGAVAGPAGAAVGAVIGGVAGGLAGKAVGEKIDPTVEMDYWRNNYKTREYVRGDAPFETYQPAYQYGVERSIQHGGRSYADVESDLASGWSGQGDTLDWDEASPAVRDAYERSCQRLRGSSTRS
jgi:hypothetical protein